MTITRAVRYNFLPTGAVRVVLAEPWAGEVRLRAFPAHIRERLEVTCLLSVTPLEGLKLRAARDAGSDFELAVREDIRCVRATLSMAENGDVRQPFLPVALMIWGRDARLEAEQRGMGEAEEYSATEAETSLATSTLLAEHPRRRSRDRGRER